MLKTRGGCRRQRRGRGEVVIGHGGPRRGGKKEPECGDTPDFVSGAVPSAFAGDSHQAPGALSPSFSLLPPEEINRGSLALKWSREDSAGAHTQVPPLAAYRTGSKWEGNNWLFYS